MPQINLDDTALEYRECGSGPPLLMVHGSASDFRSWQSQMEPFGRHYRAIACSRRYHWPNPSIPSGITYTMNEQADDLRRVIQSIGDTPLHVVGHFYGAFLSLLVAVRNPGLMRALVLLEPPVVTLFTSTRPRPRELIGLLLSRPGAAVAIMKFGIGGIAPTRRAFRTGDDETAMRTFTEAILGRGSFALLTRERKKQGFDNVSTVKAELLGPGFEPLDTAAVRKVNLPVLLVGGRKSIPLFHHLTDRLEELLPHSRRVEIDNATHLAHEENPSAFNAAVLEFAGETTPEATT